MSTSTASASPSIPTREVAAEAIGTALLVLIGPGTAILASDVVGVAGVALAFGFALTFVAYSIGTVSGSHINPAVTVGFWLAKQIDTVKAAYYVAAQIVGAMVGGLLLYIVTEGGDLDRTGVFAANGWGDEIGSSFGLGSTIVVEIVFTAILVFVVLSTTTVGFPVGFGGLAAGVTLAAIHLATIPVDNTSVNPARSLGVVFFAGSDHTAQIWAFIVFPLIGAAVGYGAWRLVHDEPAEPVTASA